MTLIAFSTFLLINILHFVSYVVHYQMSLTAVDPHKVYTVKEQHF